MELLGGAWCSAGVRSCSLVLLLALACLMALAVGAGGSAAQPGGRAGAVVTVSCRDANLREPNGVQRRVVLGVVSVPPVYVPQVVRYQSDGWAYWSKWGLSIQAGNRPVRISVPKAWRRRVGIGWGGAGPYSALRFEACSPPPTFWNVYTGGFSLRDRSVCVPLLIQVGNQSRTVRFGVGRRCS
jgi:hypothetical protein